MARRKSAAPSRVLMVLSGALMSLAAGTKLGPYEIQSVLGAGGMGESTARRCDKNPA